MEPLYLPGILRVGAGALAALPAALAQLQLHAPLVVTDAFMARSGPLERTIAVLRDAGMSVRVFDGVVPDPTVASVMAGLAVLRDDMHDCVIGLGGGSSIDTAKMLAVLARHDAHPRALKVPHVQDEPGLPVVAIPTTAGTGSEATRVSVITDEVTSEKMLCVGLAFLPRIAIVDVELTLGKPYRLTADTGLDALTHALEAYVSRRSNGFTDALALSALSAMWPALPIACETPDDRPARTAMMLGALQAGMAFSNSSVALIHGMSRPIGAHFHVAHGLSNAMLLPAVTKWSIAGAPARYATCARAMGLAGAGTPDDDANQMLVSGLAERNRALSVPTPRAYGIDPEQWSAAVPAMCEQALASGSPANNPRVPDAAQIASLYRTVFG